MVHILIDAEYAYTCAMRDGMLPNYKAIVDLFKKRYPNSILYAYFVGDKRKKKGISDFLSKIGVSYVIIMDVEHISKTQIIGSQISIDTVNILKGNGDYNDFVFLSGDDYLIPLIDYVSKWNSTPHVYYFPIIITKELEKSNNCKLFKLTDGFFTFPKEK